MRPHIIFAILRLYNYSCLLEKVREIATDETESGSKALKNKKRKERQRERERERERGSDDKCKIDTITKDSRVHANELFFHSAFMLIVAICVLHVILRITRMCAPLLNHLAKPHPRNQGRSPSSRLDLAD